ncbi:MAG: penicillin-binding protein 2 [bacterium]
MKIDRVPAQRLNILWIMVYAGAMLLAVRLLDIQILRHQQYKEAAERNRTQVIRQTAPRGRIFSCDGVAVATNRPAFSLIFLPGKIKDPVYLKRLAADFSPKLKATSRELLAELQKAFERGSPVRLAENLPAKTMFALSELKTRYPGVSLIVEAQRFYPFGSFASHLLGYMGKMNAGEWSRARREGKNYQIDSNVGRTGIEKVFERELRGRDGGLYLEVDARGRLNRILKNETWYPGFDVHLTIDSQVQMAAEGGLRSSLSKKGAVVALNPSNGEILALASVPDFDSNIFVSPRDVQREFYAVPEFNTAIQGTFPPGSIFKIVTAAAAIETGRVSPQDKFFCPGYYDAGNRIFRCWEKKGHNKTDFLSGLAHSCDVYFYNIGLRTGAANIEKYERAFRLGMPTGIALPGEKRGNVFGPTERVKRRTYWFIGDTLNLSIGQGELLVTPIQMAQMISAVANRGTFWRPRYIDRVSDQDGKTVYQERPELLSTISLKPETWDILREGLKKVVSEGTGSQARINGIDVYGKTGTAQNPGGEDHAWFVAFAEVPGRQSEIAVAVLVQYGKHGASSAAPVAKSVIEAALRGKIPSVRATTQVHSSEVQR